MDITFDPLIKPIPKRFNYVKQTPLHMKKAAQDVIDELIDKRIIVPVIEPTDWCAPAFFVPKPDGRARLVTNYTYINQFIKRPVHPFPSPKAILQSILPDSQCFIVMDCRHSYYQMGLSEDASYKTTFLLESGRYGYLRGPMGLCTTMVHQVRRRGGGLKLRLQDRGWYFHTRSYMARNIGTRRNSATTMCWKQHVHFTEEVHMRGRGKLRRHDHQWTGNQTWFQTGRGDPEVPTPGQPDETPVLSRVGTTICTLHPRLCGQRHRNTHFKWSKVYVYSASIQGFLRGEDWNVLCEKLKLFIPWFSRKTYL